MFRNPQTMLEYEARKNPTLAALIANIPNLTEDQIKTHPMRMLPWVRRELIHMCQSVQKKAILEQTIASIEPFIIDGTMPDPMGETRRWMGDNEFLKLRRGHLEIRYGELVWLDQHGGVWIDSIYCRPYDPKLLTHTQVIGEMSRLAYMDAIRDRVRGQAMPDTPLLTGLSDPAASSPLAGVQIYRPG